MRLRRGHLAMVDARLLASSLQSLASTLNKTGQRPLACAIAGLLS